VSHKCSNKASLPRTFDVEIQFPSWGSRDVSRPFPFLYSLSFCFFLVCSPVIRSFFHRSYLARETWNVKIGDFYLFFLSCAKKARRTNRSAYLLLYEYFALGDHANSRKNDCRDEFLFKDPYKKIGHKGMTFLLQFSSLRSALLMNRKRSYILWIKFNLLYTMTKIY